VLYKIVDQSCLSGSHSHLLESYLQDGNIALLSDYTFLESTKGNTRVNLRKSIALLSLYPSQVRFLKGITDIITLTCEYDGNRLGLINLEASAKVVGIFEGIMSDTPTHLWQNLFSNHFFAERKKEAEDTITFLRTVKEAVPAGILKAYRNWEQGKDELHHWVRAKAILQSRLWASQSGYTAPPLESILNWLGYRMHMVYMLYYVRWKANAIDLQQSNEVVNDIADGLNSALSTYFDGFLSPDTGKNQEYQKIEYFVSLGSTINPQGI
jgi:hypothetical protein